MDAKIFFGSIKASRLAKPMFTSPSLRLLDEATGLPSPVHPSTVCNRVFEVLQSSMTRYRLWVGGACDMTRCGARVT